MRTQPLPQLVRRSPPAPPPVCAWLQTSRMQLLPFSRSLSWWAGWECSSAASALGCGTVRRLRKPRSRRAWQSCRCALNACGQAGCCCRPHPGPPLTTRPAPAARTRGGRPEIRWPAPCPTAAPRPLQRQLEATQQEAADAAAALTDEQAARREAESWKPRLDEAQRDLFKLEKALELKVGSIAADSAPLAPPRATVPPSGTAASPTTPPPAAPPPPRPRIRSWRRS